MLPHLDSGYAVDQAILSEEDRVVIIRFGHDWDPACMKMDETLYHVADKIKNFAVMYVSLTNISTGHSWLELSPAVLVPITRSYVLFTLRKGGRCCRLAGSSKQSSLPGCRGEL